MLLDDMISYQNSLYVEFQTELLLHDLALVLPKREMRIIRMKAQGDKMHDIAKSEHLTFREINRLLLKVYPTVIKILNK